MVRNPSTDALTTSQAGELLGVSVRTVQLWVESGVLAAWKTPGGHRRIARESVQAVLDGSIPTSIPATDRDLAARTASGPLRVLVAEDDTRLRRLYELTMNAWQLPIELHLAADGFEALLDAGRHQPHMIITDLDMPNIDGFEMLRALRARPRDEVGRIVVVTGLEDDEIRRRGGLPDGVLVLRKPIPFTHLKAELERLLTLREELR